MLKTSRYLIFFLCINIVTFFVYGIDKRKAKQQLSRISEKTLLRFCLIGGGIGALLAMSYFHHKTQKGSFLIKCYAIIILWIFLVISLLVA